MSESQDAALLQWAELVVDGQPVDWQTASHSEAAGARLEHLQTLAVIARVCGMPSEASDSGGAVLFRWGHLEIREKLGEGMFGEVFRAWDTTLERDVAVKFLHPGAMPTALPALSEGRRLARVRHPGVVTVHGAEQLDGRVGIWMEHIRGRTLEDLLQEHGPFTSHEAILIGIDLCRALAAVHRSGLVHRDVKARNVVREDTGRIVLMDFGAGVTGSEEREAVGLAGTPIYLAPEVLRGEPATPKSDLYGLGVLLYHLVTGGYPIEAPSLELLRSAHARGELRPLRATRPGLPPSFVRAVERALAADAAKRFATAEQMEAALAAALAAPRRAARRRAWLAGLAAGAAVLALGVGVATRQSPAPPEPLAERAPIAVADVVHHLGDAELNAIAGMLTTSLEQSHTLPVLTRSRMRDLLAGAGNLEEDRVDRATGLEVCRMARARALLVPMVRRIDDRYRIDLEVLDPRRGRRLFTTAAEAAGKLEIPPAIDALSRRVRAELDRDPEAARTAFQPVAQISTTSLSAYDHYDRSERLIDRLEMREARAELESAIALDSTFGLAHSRLAYVCWWLHDPKCEREQLDRAFARIDRVPEKQRYHLRAQGAMADRQGLEAARSILLDMERFYPHEKEMLYDIGDYSSHLNEFPIAIQYLERVVAMDAGFARALQHLAMVYRDLGRSDRFLDWARRYAAADSSSDSDVLLGNALIAAGHPSTGIEMLAHRRELAPERTNDCTIAIARSYFFQGRPADGLLEWDRLLGHAASPSWRAEYLHQRALCRIHQGAYREALADLERAAAVADRSRDPIKEAIVRVDAARLHLLGRNDRRAAIQQMARCEDLGAAITYRDAYFQYWPYWGGLFKLHLLNRDDPAAEALAREKFQSDKWYGPYVESYLRAARGECAQAAATASRVLEWGPAGENIQLLYFLGRCQFEHGHLNEAVESLTRQQALYSHLELGTPYYARGLMLLGEVYERRGETRQAVASYTKLIDLWKDGDHDLPDHLEARRRIEKLKAVFVARD